MKFLHWNRQQYLSISSIRLRHEITCCFGVNRWLIGIFFLFTFSYTCLCCACSSYSVSPPAHCTIAISPSLPSNKMLPVTAQFIEFLCPILYSFLDANHVTVIGLYYIMLKGWYLNCLGALTH